MKLNDSLLNSCAIREFTADGVSVGRCWFYLPDGKTCPRHGDVSEAQKNYADTGRLTNYQPKNLQWVLKSESIDEALGKSSTEAY